MPAPEQYITVKIGVLTTEILEAKDAERRPSGGYFENEIYEYVIILENSKMGVRAYTENLIARYLSGSVYQTGVPVEKWIFNTDLRFAQKYDFPLQLKFG